jgi:GNAT superfamily N-acetyltransferase
MNAEIIIKKAQLKHAVALEKISVDTFRETFSSQNTKADMDQFLKEYFNLGAIKTELSDKDTDYYMAFLDDQLSGYVKIRKASHSDFKDLKGLEIARLYVYETYQNKKTGASLMQFVLDHARSKGYEVIWLGVWEHNPKAIKFYGQWGFNVFGQHIFRLGTDDQNDLLMCKYL